MGQAKLGVVSLGKICEVSVHRTIGPVKLKGARLGREIIYESTECKWRISIAFKS